MQYDPHNPVLASLANRATRCETLISEWTEVERHLSVAQMRVWRRATFAYSLIFALIGIANLEMPESIWLLRAAFSLAIMYIITSWVWRIFSEGKLLGPLTWLSRHPTDLLNING